MPGGTLTVMVYNRSSINYRIEISVLRKAFRLFLRLAFMPHFMSRITGFSREKLERHRALMLSRPKMSAAEWVSINTDCPDCPLARVYGRRKPLSSTSTMSEAAFGTSTATICQSWGSSFPMKAERWLGRRWGWHRVVEATKPVQRASATGDAGRRGTIEQH
jgi:hypothetical protein